MGSFQGRPFADAALRCDRVTHVISCTRPSRFSACNIEKLGMGLGTRLVKSRKRCFHYYYACCILLLMYLILTQDNKLPGQFLYCPCCKVDKNVELKLVPGRGEPCHHCPHSGLICYAVAMGMGASTRSR